jgi:hypothetical protein
MRTNWILGTAVVAMSVTAAAGAQSTKGMERPSKGNPMSMTYTGCVESVNHGGTFLLMPMANEKMDMMPSKSFVLAGTSNVKKHVGHTVSVTGSLSDGAMGTMRDDVSTLTIKTVKMIAKSCS